MYDITKLNYDDVTINTRVLNDVQTTKDCFVLKTRINYTKQKI